MHHFFIPSQAISDDQVTFPEQTGRQIQRVLRLVEGDSVMTLDNSGKMYETVLSFDGHQVTGKIISKGKNNTEPNVRIRLMACVSQREKYEWILQKGTELGVCEFLPIISQRTLVQKASAIDKKRERWETIIREAAEQSHRGKLPVLLPVMKLKDGVWHESKDALSLIAHTNLSATSLKSALENAEKQSFNLLIGPEGGFAEEEVALALQAGYQAVSLGKRVLRMETAALAIVNAVLYHSSNS